jgi:hypothetical protein
MTNVGRLTTMIDAGGSESWAYDKMRRECAEQDTMNTASQKHGFYLQPGCLARRVSGISTVIG